MQVYSNNALGVTLGRLQPLPVHLIIFTGISGSSRKGKALKRKGSKSDVGGKKSKVSHKKETKNEKNASRIPSRNRIITKVVTPRYV